MSLMISMEFTVYLKNILSDELPMTISLLCLCQEFRNAFLHFSGYTCFDDELHYLYVTMKINEVVVSSGGEKVLELSSVDTR